MHFNRTLSIRHAAFRTRALVLLAALTACVTPAVPQERPPRLLIALASFRERPLHPKVYFYEHDGLGHGKPAGGMAAANLRVDTHPTLALGGSLCATAHELENQPSDIRIWNVREEKDVTDLPGLNTEAPEIGAAISANGEWLLFSAWQRPGGQAGWGLYLYRLSEKKLVELPIGTEDDKQSPSLSGDGRYVAFVSSRQLEPGAAVPDQGRSDVRVFDRHLGRELPLPGLNTPWRELDPALSADGRFLAFVSDRPGGRGARDIYLYDLAAQKLLPLPGANEIGHEQTPALSPDGRYLAFVAERASGEGERDVYLYDRQTQRLLPTPGLNTRTEDFDPALTYLTD